MSLICYQCGHLLLLSICFLYSHFLPFLQLNILLLIFFLLFSCLLLLLLGHKGLFSNLLLSGHQLSLFSNGHTYDWLFGNLFLGH